MLLSLISTQLLFWQSVSLSTILHFASIIVNNLSSELKSSILNELSIDLFLIITSGEQRVIYNSHSILIFDTAVGIVGILRVGCILDLVPPI